MFEDRILGRIFLDVRRGSGQDGGSYIMDIFVICKKVKLSLLTGREGPYGCETSRLPLFLDSRLTDGDKAVSLTRRQPFTLQEDTWYLFLLETESTLGP
jgi:hypothetical protein